MAVSQSCEEERRSTEFSLLDSMRSVSAIVGSLHIFERLSDLFLYTGTSSGRTKNVAEQKMLQHRKSDSSVFSTDSEHNNNLPDQVKLKHSHSQSCVTGCTNEHHTKISSWRHPLHVHRSHVPKKLQEPYIEYGYFLPFMPWRYYLRTLYTPSYELMNVWTHLIPSLYFFYLLLKFEEVDIKIAWPLYLITFSGFLMCAFSAMAHLFHARSSLHHSCWFVADYFGITLYAFSSLTTNFYSGAHLQYYQLLSSHYLHICVIICFIGFTLLSVTQTNQTWISTHISRQVKVYVNGLGYIFGALPIFLRIYENLLYGETPMDLSLKLHMLALAAMLVSPIVYGLDLPQCLYPGKFDVFGHSHMWFHIITASSVWFDIHAVYYDVLNGPWTEIHQQVDYPAMGDVLFYYILLILYGVFCGHITHCSVKCDFSEEEPFLQGKLLCSCGLPETMKGWPKIRRGKSKSLSCIQEWKTEGKED